LSGVDCDALLAKDVLAGVEGVFSVFLSGKIGGSLVEKDRGRGGEKRAEGGSGNERSAGRSEIRC